MQLVKTEIILSGFKIPCLLVVLSSRKIELFKIFLHPIHVTKKRFINGFTIAKDILSLGNTNLIYLNGITIAKHHI